MDIPDTGNIGYTRHRSKTSKYRKLKRWTTQTPLKTGDEPNIGITLCDLVLSSVLLKSYCWSTTPLTSVNGVSDCCLMPSGQYFSHRYIMERTSYISMMSSLYYANTLSWIFIVTVHSNNSLRVDMSLRSDALSWFWAI
jgi:hypothetical protein